MPNLSITPNIDQAPWEDVCQACPQIGDITRIGRLPGGMQSGRSSVAILVEMPDGTKHMAQTSMALFLAAADVLRTTDQA